MIQQSHSFLGNYANENIGPPKNWHMNVYRSFVYNGQNLKQPRCPSVGEWMNKLWYIPTIERYSAVKRNEL